MNYSILLGLLVIYLGLTVLLAYIAYRRTNSSKDYLIAGGDTHPFLMAMAYGSTFISTAAIVGFGGAAGVYGMSLLWLTFMNIFVGIFIAFIVYGKRTLTIGKQLGARTFPEFMGLAFQSSFIQKFSALIIIVAMPIYAAAVMIGAGRFLEHLLNIDYTLAILGFSVIVALYVISGGLKGVFYNDALQGSIMFFGMVTLLIMTYGKLGGVINAHKALASLTSLVPQGLAAKGQVGWASMPVFGSEIWWIVVSTLVMGVGIGVLAQPQLIVRYLTVSGIRQLNRAVLIGGIFILSSTGVAFLVGALSNVYFYQTKGIISLQAVTDAVTKQPNVDNIIPLFVNQALPEWFGYLFMLTLVAAAMSTLSGQFHIIGTSLCHDLYRSSSLALNRIAILIALAISVYLALKLPVSIIAIATAIFFGICAAAFLPAYTASLYWPKVGKKAASASMVVGFSSSLLWMAFIHAKEAQALGLAKLLFGRATLLSFPWIVVDPIIIALPISIITLILVHVFVEIPQQITEKKELDNTLTALSGE
ncbi:MAG: sodium:solute symporter [Peptococcaceae bacterium BICA1-8]|nr:MAG: sodium:solute symporter [Peptococcaceae bacterium BICA1-8]